MIFLARPLVTRLRERLTITKSLATYENYAEEIYGLSITDEVEEEMSSDLAYIEEVNTTLAKLSSHPGKVSDRNAKVKKDLWV